MAKTKAKKKPKAKSKPLPKGINPEQQAFLRVPVKCLATVIAALKRAGFKSEAHSVEDFTRDYVDPEANENRLKWLARADEQVVKDGEIEVDTDSTISHSGGNGQYVLAWAWVDGPPKEEDDDDDDDEHQEESAKGP